MQVRFNDLDEYLGELRQDCRLGLIPDQLVRVTMLITHAPNMPIRHAQVVATYVARGQVVRLERYCGQLWGLESETDQQTRRKLDEARQAVEDVAEQLGLEVRAGVIEDVPPKPPASSANA